MADATEADRYLLDRLAAGDAAAWAQLVDRYQGRLLAFARSRLPRRPDDAADAVQDTFLAFLQARRSVRPDASLETFLFTILRRRLVDLFRGRRVAACGVGGDGGEVDGRDEPVDPGPTPSGHARRDERVERLEAAVAAGLDGMVRRLRDGHLLADLRMAELLFYAQVRNKDVAARCGVTEGHVAQFKFRALAQVREHAAAVPPGADALLDADAADSVLTRVWERARPTCPKRSTLGRLLLGTLDDDWRHHVEFHLHALGCRMCVANWDDLRRESTPAPEADRGRFFQSTVGFLART